MSSEAAKDSADPLLGKVLNGRFTILEAIGVGGMGRVYKAVQAPLDRVVALKVLNPAYSGGKDPGFQKRFFLEASLTSKLRHPNTITVHDYGRTDDDVYYIAMEYVEGKNLAEILSKSGALPWHRVLHIAQQICRSLREAHRMGIVHRDLKPANVMVLNEETDHDMVKVLDFGLVKPFLPDAPRAADETELTQAGVLLGSPLYMAPEQARQEADPRTDIYSLGVMMYQMLAGRPPFIGKESIEVIVKHLREIAPPLRSLKPDLPQELADAVMRCLEKDPADRFQSMDELLDVLRQAGAGLGVSAVFTNPRSGITAPPRPLPPPKPPPHATRALEPPPSPRRKLRRKLLAGGLFAGSVLAGLVVVHFASRREEPKPEPVALEPAKPTLPSPVPTPEPTPATPEPRPSADPITFKIVSSPSGARVWHEGEQLGTTPVNLRLPRGEDGSASAELRLTLAGYEPLLVSASGKEPEVEVRAKLVKKRGARTRPHHPPGYKDDPYQ